MASLASTARYPVRRTAPLYAALFVAVLALYLLTLTQVHTFDALSYVTSVERKPWTELFHPHHLAYGPLGALVLATAQTFGYRGGAAIPLQLVNALAGALGVALFCRTACRTTGRIDLALAVALLLAGSYAFWYYAVEIEVYTLAALFLIVCLDLMLRPGGWSTRRLLALGLAHGLATLFHQTNLLLAAPILACAILDLRFSIFDLGLKRSSEASGALIGAWIGRWGLYAVTAMLVVGLPYLYAIVVVSGFRTIDEALAWLTEYARTGWWGGPVSGASLADVGQGLADALAQPGGALAWLALGVCVLPWERLKTENREPRTENREPRTENREPRTENREPRTENRGLRTEDRELRTENREPRTAGHGQRATVQESAPYDVGLSSSVLGPGALLAWLLVYGAFFAWWEPDNVEFWIASLPPLLLLLAWRVANLPGNWRAFVVAGVACAMLVVNYDAITRRGDAANDLQRVVARELAARTTPADLLIIPDGLLELYLPHYEQRENFISLNQALFDARGDAGAACAVVRERIDIALHAGATAVIADEVLRPPSELLARHRMNQAQIDACFAPYTPFLGGVELPREVPPYQRLARADELARGAGWSFQTFGLGWRAANVAGERFDGGWRFRPERDPALLSPLLALEASDYTALEVRLANGTAARDAQLFFAGSDGRIDEARSVRWQLADTPAATTYRIELRGAPGWHGVISRLRLDPVGLGDGGEVRVEWVRLVVRGYSQRLKDER
jgi:hypothetical protein